jgi:hypothetical protein
MASARMWTAALRATLPRAIKAKPPEVMFIADIDQSETMASRKSKAARTARRSGAAITATMIRRSASGGHRACRSLSCWGASPGCREQLARQLAKCPKMNSGAEITAVANVASCVVKAEANGSKRCV